MSGDGQQTKAANQYGQDDYRLNGGETRPDADARAAAERQKGVT
jgi:hypothetical protein